MLKRSVHIFMLGILVLPGLAAAKGSVQLPATNQTACFDSKGNPRACSGSGEDGEAKVGVAAPSSRFIDNGNGTVTDTLTGLVWSKHANAPNRALPNDQSNGCANAETSMLWLDALDFITCLNGKSHAGFTDWRLPNLNELESMVNSAVVDSSAYLNANGFGFGSGSSQVQPSQYWTATSDASDPTIQSAAAAWDVDLAKGDAFSTLKNELTRGVWPVRGVSNGPAQLIQTGQTGCFDDVGDTRPCAGTGEDGGKQAGVALPATRFQVNASATFAVDSVTGLIWTTKTQTPGPAACADTGLNLDWQQALDHVVCLNTSKYLGRSDWRLPNRQELQSLADYSRGAPALPGGHQFDDKLGKTYWSGTTDAASPTEAMVVRLLDGNISSAIKVGTLPALPVSGPDLLPPTLTLNPVTTPTNKKSQTLSGTVEAGSTVAVVAGTTAVPATVDSTGTTWSAVIPALAEGANTITVTATDASGNTTTLPPATITLDTIPPVTTATPAPGKYTDSVAVTLASEAGSTIHYTTDGTAVTTASPVYSAPIRLAATATTPFTVQFMAVDQAGNTEPVKNAAYTIQLGCDLNGDGKVDVADALKALQITIGLYPPTPDDMTRGDVAPLVNGKPKPNGMIDIADTLIILQRGVGLVLPW